MLTKAYNEKYAIPHFNIYNYEVLHSVITAADEINAPIIVAITVKTARNFGGFKCVVNMIKNLVEFREIKTEVCIHLDHCKDPYYALKAIDCGFTSIMYDGSALPIEENLANSKMIIDYAKKNNVTVETEVGQMSDNDNNDEFWKTADYQKRLVDVTKKMRDIGADYVALSLGSVHGYYEKTPNFDEKLFKKYSDILGRPLVLHGGSGIPKDQVAKLIANGVSKINIGTDLRVACIRGYKQFIAANPIEGREMFNQIFAFGESSVSNMKKVAKERIREFGCENKIQ